MRIVCKGNDEHGYLHLGGNDELKRRAQKAGAACEHEHTLVIMTWFIRKAGEMVRRT